MTENNFTQKELDLIIELKTSIGEIISKKDYDFLLTPVLHYIAVDILAVNLHSTGLDPIDFVNDVKSHILDVHTKLENNCKYCEDE